MKMEKMPDNYQKKISNNSGEKPILVPTRPPLKSPEVIRTKLASNYLTYGTDDYTQNFTTELFYLYIYLFIYQTTLKKRFKYKL